MTIQEATKVLVQFRNAGAMHPSLDAQEVSEQLQEAMDTWHPKDLILLAQDLAANHKGLLPS